jgi:hypothetical protein
MGKANYARYEEINALYKEGKSFLDIIKILKSNTSTIDRALAWGKVERRPVGHHVGKRFKYSCDDNYLNKIDTPEKAWILGWWMSDGCIKRRGNDKKITIKLHENDLDVLEKIKKLLNANNPIYHTKPHYKTLSISSQQLFDDFDKIGCIERKTHVLKFPQIDNKLIKYYVLGYFEGDGTAGLYFTNNHWKSQFKITSSSKDFIEIISKLFDTKCALYEKTNVYYSQTQSSLRVYRILHWLYSDVPEYMRMNRKYETWLKVKEWYESKYSLPEDFDRGFNINISEKEKNVTNYLLPNSDKTVEKHGANYRPYGGK